MKDSAHAPDHVSGFVSLPLELFNSLYHFWQDILGYQRLFNGSPSSADAFSAEHGVTFLTTITDKFEVAFGTEGETVSLGCTVIVYPTVKNYQPEVVWYRNCK